MRTADNHQNVKNNIRDRKIRNRKALTDVHACAEEALESFDIVGLGS